MDYDMFSDRLVDSINMVRELLLSNKEIREKEEQANLKVFYKNTTYYTV
jgi:kinesin family protein 4/21/27